MNKQQYDSVKASMRTQRELSKSLKFPTPQGALTDLNIFRHLPVGSLFWMVWSLGPATTITPAMTRKESVEDHKQDHLGSSFIIDLNRQFLYSDLRADEYSDRSYREYSNDYYDSYNLGPEAYNDSYVFLNEENAKAYFEACKLLPRFKNEEEKRLFDESMAEMEAISDSMTYDFIEDDRYDK